jgi:hypothetical protein
MEVSSFAHRETALLLQAAYGDYQIGAFENFYQPVEDILIVLRPGPKIFFQYELRFANCLNGQLVISHPFLPIKKWCPEETKNRSNDARDPSEQKIKSNFGQYPRYFLTVRSIFVSVRETLKVARADHRSARAARGAPFVI